MNLPANYGKCHHCGKGFPAYCKECYDNLKQPDNSPGFVCPKCGISNDDDSGTLRTCSACGWKEILAHHPV